ncbi:MAG TPA: ATP-binding cassette domain-containing protein, partial [Rhodoblastus sp.]|nr:ATP-binding cassette domain-containing protein [Rhodoblastus sp.]
MTVEPSDETKGPDAIIRVRDLVVAFGPKTIMRGLDLDVRRGEVLGFVGGSGQGKSVLTRTILGLVQKRSGKIEVFGKDLDKVDMDERRALER